MNPVLIFIAVMLPFAAAVVCYCAGRYSKGLRDWLCILAAAIELVVSLVMAFSGSETVSFDLPNYFGLGLSLELTGFARVYCVVTAFAWLAALVFSREYMRSSRNRNRYYFFTLLTLGASQGIFLAADLTGALLFLEIMSFTSYVWVAHDETESAMRAAGTYLGIAIIGGLASLMGLFILSVELGTTRIDELGSAFTALRDSGVGLGRVYTGAAFALVGFAAKAGLVPLHVWMPRAYTAAPAPASALLSSILSKAGAFGVAAITCRLMTGDVDWATAILILGAATMLLGSILALLSTDLKRTLACSSMAQIGFIVIGIGCCGILGSEGALAARGTALHMLNHTLIKLVLFLVAGAIFMNTGSLDLNQIRGYGRKKPMLAIVFLFAALGVSGIPLFNGYLSKSLLHEGILESVSHLSALGYSTTAMTALEWLFLFGGGLTLAYMAKLFFAVFVEKNNDAELQADYDSKKLSCSSPLSMVALAVCAVMIPVLGILPGVTAAPLSAVSSDLFGVTAEGSVAWFSLENLQGAGISIVIGVVVYFAVVRTLLVREVKAAKKGKKKVETTGVKQYVNILPAWLDLENLIYRPIVLRVLPAIFGGFFALTDSLPNRIFTPKLLSRLGMSTHGSSDLVDLIIVLLRRSLFHESPRTEESKYERTFAYRFGAYIDRRRAKHHRRNAHYAEELVSIEKTIGETTHRITGSLSFALLMLCVGLTFAFIYLMFLK